MVPRKVNLIQWMPEHLKEIPEFQQMCKAEDIELQLLWDRLIAVSVDMDMYRMSEQMCERWEKFFNIKNIGLHSLDDRRQLIRGYFTSQLPYNLEKLDSTLKAMCGEDLYKLVVRTSDSWVDIGIALESKFAYQNIIEVTRQMIPAHISINVYLIYNTHEVLGRYTHAQLAKYTHKELRDTVISGI